MIGSGRTLGLNGIHRVGTSAETTTVPNNRELGPYQPTLVGVERLMGEGSKRVDIPVATNDLGAKWTQRICGVRGLWKRRYGGQSQDKHVNLEG